MASGSSSLPKRSILSPFTQLQDTLHPLIFPAVPRTPANFSTFFHKTVSYHLTTERHMCCSLCFYLELRISTGSVCTWTSIFCLLVCICGCEHTSLHELHGFAFRCVHGHVGFWITTWAWDEFVFKVYTHIHVSKHVSMAPCARVYGVVGCISCASGFVCILMFVCQCAYGVNVPPLMPQEAPRRVWNTRNKGIICII